MKRFKYKKSLRAAALLPVFLVSLISAPFLQLSTNANAASDAKINTYFSHELTPEGYLSSLALYAFLDCFRANPDRGPIPPGAPEIQNLEIIEKNTIVRPVGYLLEPQIENGDGQSKCVEAGGISTHPYALGAIADIGVSNEEFIDYFYNKDERGYFMDEDGEAKIEAALQKNFVKGDYQLRQVELLTAFSQCYDERDTGAEKAGKKFDFINGKNKDSVIPVGWWVSGDGRFQCETLFDMLDDGTLIDLHDREMSTGNIRTNPKAYINALMAGDKIEDAKQVARDKLTLLFAANPQRMLECAAVALPAGATDYDVDTLALSSADMMIDPEGTAIIVGATDEQNTAYRSCLAAEESPYHDAIVLIMEEYSAATEDAENWREGLDSLGTEDENGGAGEADPCLESDAFLGWFVCPVINIIVGFTEKLQDMIEGALKFDLSEIGTTDEGSAAIKESWGIFRGLATTLLILGFLIALLVKAIKG